MVPSWFDRDLMPGSTGDAVEVVQLMLRTPITGVYDELTIQRVRGYQYLMALPVTGIVDEKTAEMIGDPVWFPVGGMNARQENAVHQAP